MECEISGEASVEGLHAERRQFETSSSSFERPFVFFGREDSSGGGAIAVDAGQPSEERAERALGRAWVERDALKS